MFTQGGQAIFQAGLGGRNGAPMHAVVDDEKVDTAGGGLGENFGTGIDGGADFSDLFATFELESILSAQEILNRFAIG